MSSFGSAYALSYDALYKDKDYEGECDLLLDILRGRDGYELRRILDLGCGTGSHASILAQRGLEVVGVDRSADMTEIARQKAAKRPPHERPQFVTADIRRARLETKFDAVLMMFAVLGYQRTNDDVIAALVTARTHLDKGGLLAFDVWYGPAVLSQRPSQRVAVVDGDSHTIIRVAAGSLDTRSHVCTVDYRLWILDGRQLVDDVAESHVLRYFFPLELALLLQIAGFSLLRLGGFPDYATDPDDSSWNVLGLARAV
jgi:SAM-dependent methyltransferase